MRSILSIFQFTTVLPLGKPVDLQHFARRSYIFPLAGYVIGGIAAIPALFAGNTLAAAAIAVALVILLSGAHHFDGLIDLGDGLMAHGDREKRIRALTDKYAGAGGIAAGLVVTLLLFAGLAGAASIAWAIIAGEVCAKFSMAFLTAYGTPFKGGMQKYLHDHSKPYFPFISILLCLPLLLLPLTTAQIAGAAAAAIACPAILLAIADRLFGGVNGDVVGASNEITRACVVLVIALL
jgi:adenosylcobinamide-GDP ribazoletransferase